MITTLKDLKYFIPHYLNFTVSNNNNNIHNINNEFYSNCLIEAIKAKLNNINVVIYMSYDRDHVDNYFIFPHFYWKDRDLFYHFNCMEDESTRLIDQLWFRGRIVRYLWRKNDKANINNYRII
jgi:hypothetical protein